MDEVVVDEALVWRGWSGWVSAAAEAVQETRRMSRKETNIMMFDARDKDAVGSL